MVATLVSLAQHTTFSLPLLPSGPGGICEKPLRGTNKGRHKTTDLKQQSNKAYLNKESLPYLNKPAL
tara:strand:- start:4436 stop:4636 length:201 start_codon:yes stop_codon:yes gene_type:complete